MDIEDLKEYGKANGKMFSSEMRAAFKRVLEQKKQQQQPQPQPQPQPKRKKRRAALSPILGAVLKFHKDDGR
ncbi:unnamed protein product [Triticum turgidum subsp. durum]|uniref:Uncharacterized protein n=1 Tax=Triticum turgidum subsp. durum TaxID=4567 RepID=A0A9R0QPP6_TRITD|nr:unnamed protein product [Triticum turgidum subsp. durum]